MANGHGGVRQPRNPAPVSGPGAMSKRTDGGPAQPARYMSGGDYGDGQEMMSLQQSAPMAASPAPQTQAQWAGGQQGPPAPTPLDAPTERPDEPLTHGSPMGAGAGPGVLANSAGPAGEWGTFKQYLPMLTEAANQKGVSPTFVQFVRFLRDK